MRKTAKTIWSDEALNILFEICDNPDRTHIPLVFGKGVKEGKDVFSIHYSKKNDAVIIE